MARIPSNTPDITSAKAGNKFLLDVSNISTVTVYQGVMVFWSSGSFNNSSRQSRT